MELTGVFDRYIVRDDEAGYVRMRVRLARGRYAIFDSSCCIPDEDIPAGTPLTLECEPREEVRGNLYEKGYRFSDYTITGARDKQEAIDFLLGMNIRGVKEKSAEKIVEVTGNDIANWFAETENPDQVLRAEVRGLSEQTIRAIRARLPHRSALNDFYREASACGMTYTQARIIYNAVVKGNDRTATLEYINRKLSADSARNPDNKSLYDYARVADAEFRSTDRLAAKLGYTGYNPRRIEGFVHAAMAYVYRQGSTWTSLPQLYMTMRRLTIQTEFPETVIALNAIYAVVTFHPEVYRVENCGEKIMLVDAWRDEKAVSYHTARLKERGVPLPFPEDVNSLIPPELVLSSRQKSCFEFLKRSGVKIITGNAGTGKTTVISALIRAYRASNPNGNIALCAPTGRAAQRMTELCRLYSDDGPRIRASTIHKLLNIVPWGDEIHVEYTAANPLPSDLIIVDEMSMVDIHLFAMLISAIRDSALLILCGDADQLPSVGAGKVFRDLIDSRRIEYVRLDTIYRQSANCGNIVINASRINTGDGELNAGPDFRILTAQTEEEMHDRVLKIAWEEEGPKTVLAAMRGGVAGAVQLNADLQPILNKKEEQGVLLPNGQTVKTGDVILMTRNNYKYGYVNGDVGTVLSAGSGHIVAEFGADRRDLKGEALRDTSLAYAMTIHKSQGSEYDDVVIVLPEAASHMMSKNLLYTAVTRARKSVTLITQPGAVEAAVKRTTESKRQTMLCEFLKKEVEGEK